jgi:hypothetical protein
LVAQDDFSEEFDAEGPELSHICGDSRIASDLSDGQKPSRFTKEQIIAILRGQ